jgi:hypothetical protein
MVLFVIQSNLNNSIIITTFAFFYFLHNASFARLAQGTLIEVH